jgi:MFS family permease
VKGKRIYYGWWIVAACLVGLIVAGGSGFYCFGVFFPRFMREFHWSRAASAAAISVYWIGSGLTSPFIGRLVDRYGPKRVMVSGTLMTGFSLIMLGATNSLTYLYAFYGLLSVSHVATILVPYGFLISRWFRAKRGKAMGIATSGVSFGGIILVPITELLIRRFGWRISYLILGVLVVAILLPVILLVIKASPEEAGCLPDGIAIDRRSAEQGPADQHPGSIGSSPIPPWELSQILLTLPFWLMSLSLFSTYAVMFGVLTHQIPFILDMGIPSTTAAFAFGFTALMGIVGKLAIGFIADRHSVKGAAVFTLGLQLIAVLILSVTSTMSLLWVYVVLFGLSMGGATLRPLIPTWLFGLSSLGLLQGVTQMATSAGSAIGPYFAGYIFDLFGSYQFALLVFAIICGLGLAAIAVARPPLPPLCHALKHV